MDIYLSVHMLRIHSIYNDKIHLNVIFTDNLFFAFQNLVNLCHCTKLRILIILIQLSK